MCQCHNETVVLNLSKLLSSSAAPYCNLHTLNLKVKQSASVYISLFQRLSCVKTLSLYIEQSALMDTIEVLSTIVTMWHSTLLELDLQFPESMSDKFLPLLAIGLPLLYFKQLNKFTLCFKELQLDLLCGTSVIANQIIQDQFQQILLTLIDRHLLTYVNIGVPDKWYQSLYKRLLQARPNIFTQIRYDSSTK